MCPAGPSTIDFLTAVGAASELISGVIVSDATRDQVATNDSLRYAIDERLGLTIDALNGRIRRKPADSQARSGNGRYEETIPFDGRIERPLLTLHGTGDLFVPVSLEQTLKQAVDDAGRSQLLVACTD